MPILTGMAQALPTESTPVRLATVRRLAATGEARRIRQAANLSQSEIAAEVRVHEATVSQWESGKQRPRGDAALRYLDVLEALS
jgi:DNA-binding transcriptional regulator YiaG